MILARVHPARLAVGFIAALVAVGALALSPSATSAESPPQGITVVGEGRARAEPDTAIINVGTSVQAPTVGEAWDLATQSTSDLALILETDFGIPEEDIQTQSINVFPVYGSGPIEPGLEPAPPEIVGYQVDHVLSVRTHDLGTVGPILDAAARRLGNTFLLQGVFFTLDDPAPHQEAARRAAFENARAAAEQLADLAGVELGDVIAIEELSPVVSIPVDARGGEGALPSPLVSGPPIFPGQTEVSVVLRVTFAIAE